ncbi:MAG: DNA repair protein RadA [Ectothiorhodospiraceae bacterium]|nr:DNA repair protein RadA [Chromatiales bacterium]MCP5157084.1 DNA repair protein RadA [Ectothiorhodospiraceae bacterium]
MARARSLHVCQSCGAQATKWSGQCAECGEWNTLVEMAARAPGAAGGAASGGRRGGAGWVPGQDAPGIQDLGAIEAAHETRVPTGMGELDRVLGGGLVAGSVVLIGGDPGVGKSTLLLQVLASLRAIGGDPLYVSGEESARQVALRAQRLGLDARGLHMLPETNLERILELAARDRPSALVIDSIQTLWSAAIESAPGSVSQVRECGAALVRFAKGGGTPVFLVGHVTKEGALAGPRVLEHMVDTVLYFEAEANRRYRVVRAVKNRFGAANELGLFAMTDRGLRAVSNPSAIFLSRHGPTVPGSLVTVTREGTRPLLLELQALVDDSALANPRRVTVGLDPNRLAMLLAVVNRHAGVATQGMDVYVNVVGGVRISETAADLPVLAAVLSSLRNRPLEAEVVVFGEVGLAGEIRPVPNGLERLAEAAKHGFRRAVVPRDNRPKSPPDGIEVVGVERLAEALDLL